MQLVEEAGGMELAHNEIKKETKQTSDAWIQRKFCRTMKKKTVSFESESKFRGSNQLLAQMRLHVTTLSKRWIAGTGSIQNLERLSNF
ncbi:hypothetical protein ACLB2K_060096 [Fragaria x ananassa]